VTSSGAAVATVAAGKTVTLTATVKAGSTAVTAGLVNFCDATAAFCTDIHLLGAAQLTTTGTAVFKFRPGLGSHSYKAVFAGTNSHGASSSATATLKVTGASGAAYASSAAITQSGSLGNYSLKATVGGTGAFAPTGTVSFLDSTYGNAALGTATLTAAAKGASWSVLSTPVVGDDANSFAVGDFNGDGIPDLAVLNYDALTVLLGNGDGSFAIAANSPIKLSEGATAIAAGDFNGDGIPDLAVTSEKWVNNTQKNTVTILLGSASGTFTQAAGTPASVGRDPGSIVVADFNGDGIADLAVANGNSNTVSILLGNGKGAFTAAPQSPVTVGNNPWFIATGDFNGDGIADLAVANTGSNTISILLGSGKGTFTPAAPLAVGATAIAVGDFNEDGKADLAVVLPGNSQVDILTGNGNGTFTAVTGSPITLSGYLSFVTVGDFNGDGIADLAVTSQSNPGAVTFLLGNGNGSFTQAANSPVTTGGYDSFAAVGDFNGDGISDLAVVNQSSNTVSILQTAAQTATATVTGIAVAGLGPHQVVASYPGDSNYNSTTSGSTALYAPTPAPVFSLASGSYSAIQTLKITDAAAKSTIYYTTDGSTPNTWSTQYYGAITVTSSETIKTIAVATGYGKSAAATATYTLHVTPTPTPKFSLASGSYKGTQTVTITDTAPEYTIYYTTYGETPTTSSSKYTGAISVYSSETIKAIAVTGGEASSAVAKAVYTIK
jgi:hypothetical protein